jgi:hypothetical protein
VGHLQFLGADIDRAPVVPKARQFGHQPGQYKALRKAGALVKKRVSTHGSVPAIISCSEEGWHTCQEESKHSIHGSVPPILSWLLWSYFQVLRQQCTTLGEAAEGRAFSLNNSTWLPAENACLLMEIFLDQDYAKVTDAAFIKVIITSCRCH